MESVVKKKSLVVLAADLPRVDDLVDMIARVGSQVAALKTHVDMVDDFSMDEWGRVIGAAQAHDLMLFEDRKFADIGKVAQAQMGGLYDIRSWADLVTAHSVSGPDALDGIASAWDGVQRVGGILLLAQMSSRDNLLSEEYGSRTLEFGAASPHVIGYIGNGSSPAEIGVLRAKAGDGRMIWTPGVRLTAAEGVLGQRYGHPGDAVRAGSDAVIVGSGIHGAEDPEEAARSYAEASWKALLGR
jgi:orotidine 5'-phosphate decarboxylase subfamily 1